MTGLSDARQKTCATIERKYGLKIVEGRETDNERRFENHKAKDVEAETWEPSDCREALLLIKQQSSTWAELHDGIDQFGLILKKRGHWRGSLEEMLPLNAETPEALEIQSNYLSVFFGGDPKRSKPRGHGEAIMIDEIVCNMVHFKFSPNWIKRHVGARGNEAVDTSAVRMRNEAKHNANIPMPFWSRFTFSENNLWYL